MKIYTKNHKMKKTDPTPILQTTPILWAQSFLLPAPAPSAHLYSIPIVVFISIPTSGKPLLRSRPKISLNSQNKGEVL